MLILINFAAGSLPAQLHLVRLEPEKQASLISVKYLALDLREPIQGLIKQQMRPGTLILPLDLLVAMHKRPR